MWNPAVLHVGQGKWRLAPAMATKLGHWRGVATSKEVGLTEKELAAFEPAFEHEAAAAARALAG